MQFLRSFDLSLPCYGAAQNLDTEILLQAPVDSSGKTVGHTQPIDRAASQKLGQNLGISLVWPFAALELVQYMKLRGAQDPFGSGLLPGPAQLHG